MEKRTVLVSNLPTEFTEEDIRAIFGDIGPIVNLSLTGVGESKVCRIDYDSEGKYISEKFIHILVYSHILFVSSQMRPPLLRAWMALK
jgi:RNA recognition motif-containing protein